MPETIFRFRCPDGKHAGIVAGKLYCTACGRFRDETDEEYVGHLDAKILSLGGARPTGHEDFISYKEAYIRILHGVANDPDPDLDDEDLN